MVCEILPEKRYLILGELQEDFLRIRRAGSGEDRRVRSDNYPCARFQIDAGHRRVPFSYKGLGSRPEGQTRLGWTKRLEADSG